MNTRSDYVRAHKNVRKARGRASRYPCMRCGLPAEDWAYAYGEDTPLEDPRGTKFSWDTDQYNPLCRKCHIAHDREKDLQLEDRIHLRAIAAGEGVRQRLKSPGGMDVFVSAGKKAAAMKYRCGGCDKICSAGSLALHQRATGHVGRKG